MTKLSSMPHLLSILRRGRLKHLVPSKTSRNLSLCSTLDIRSIFTFRSRSSSESSVSRTPLMSRARSKYSAHASLSWRSFSNSPREVRRKQNFGKDYQCTPVIPIRTGCSNHSSKLEDIEVQLRSLREESALLRLVENTRDSEDVNELLDDLQEAVNGYMVRSRLWHSSG